MLSAHTLIMPKILTFPSSREKPPRSAVDPRVAKIADAIKALLSTLSPDEQHEVLEEIIRAVRPIDAPRAGEVLGTIIRWMPREREWTVEEAKRVVFERSSAHPKEVYNAIGYLVRTGRLKRVGYGRYWLDGVGLETLDDLGLEPLRNEDD
jgi:hypothetical protein